MLSQTYRRWVGADAIQPSKSRPELELRHKPVPVTNPVAFPFADFAAAERPPEPVLVAAAAAAAAVEPAAAMDAAAAAVGQRGGSRMTGARERVIKPGEALFKAGLEEPTYAASCGDPCGDPCDKCVDD